jgi:pimeloyl-ACP methyl ester carboxylesterase
LSWGTILGTRLVARSPALYKGYVGMGQMVNTTENDRIGYDLALKVATDRGDARTADALRRNGPPPYDGEGMALKYAAYNNVLFDHMGNARLELILLLVPQLAREYGLLDRLNFDRGLIESYAVLYPQLRDLDFTSEASRIEVPMFFLVGRNDVNAVAALVERYYAQLQAPHKEIIWLESGHGASAEEIRDAMVTRVLPLTR